MLLNLTPRFDISVMSVLSRAYKTNRRPLKVINASEASKNEDVEKLPARLHRNKPKFSLSKPTDVQKVIPRDVGGKMTAISKSQFSKRWGLPRQEGYNSKKYQKITAAQTHNLNIEKLKQNDLRFGPVIVVAKSVKQRSSAGICMVEGKGHVIETLEAGGILLRVYFTDPEILTGLPEPILFQTECFQVRTPHFRLWSDLTYSQGLIGIFELPRAKDESTLLPREDVMPVTLVCDGIQDGGNLGTLIRCAASVGVRKILLAPGCTDPWQSKVIRASVGANFQIPIRNDMSWNEIHRSIPVDSAVYLIHPSFLFEREVGGLSHNERKMIEQARLITAKYEETASKQETEHHDFHNKTARTEDIDENYPDRIDAISDISASSLPSAAQASATTISATDDYSVVKQITSLSEIHASKDLMKLYRRLDLPTYPYYDCDLNKGHVTFIIGSENKGFSDFALKLAYDRFGCRLFMPMVHRQCSINAAMAASIVLFESRRQYLSQVQK